MWPAALGFIVSQAGCEHSFFLHTLLRGMREMEEGAFRVCKLLSQLTKCRNNELKLEIKFLETVGVCKSCIFHRLNTCVDV